MTVYANLIGKTPEAIREMARESARRSQESFERSDTDGYLSQWASDITATVYHFAARLAEKGWKAELDALFDLDGNLVTTELRQTQYGSAWMIRNADGSVSWVNPSNALKAATRRANMEKKGYRVGTISRRVVPATASGGAYNVYPVALPDRDHPEVTIVSTDDPGEDY